MEVALRVAVREMLHFQERKHNDGNAILRSKSAFHSILQC